MPPSIHLPLELVLAKGAEVDEVVAELLEEVGAESSSSDEVIEPSLVNKSFDHVS